MDDNTAQQRARVTQYFVDTNLDGDPIEVISPSGRYRLVIRSYRTKPGCWNYTRGTVVRIADDTIVCDIQRNFSHFHHSFVTKNGHEYLITGRSYTSQTIVDLDSGRELEPDGDQYKDTFCWARCYLSTDGKTLIVDGCIWGCPYELRFFDFTDPVRGWRALPIIGADRVEDPSDRQKPQWLDATTVDCFQYDASSEPQERTRLQRRGDTMVVTEHWLSERERLRRDAEARAEAEQDGR